MHTHIINKKINEKILVKKYLKFQVVCYNINHDKLLKLDNILAKLKNETMKNDKFSSIMLSPLLYYSNKITIPLIVSGYAIMMTLYSQPALFMIRQFKNNPDSIKYILPYPAVYPYHIEGGSFLWAFHWMWETLIIFIAYTAGCTSDNLFGYYAVNIVAQFRVLSYEIEYTSTENYDNKELRRFHEYIVTKHHEIIECCELLEYINGPIVLSMTISIALILCTLIFQIRQVCIFILILYNNLFIYI